MLISIKITQLAKSLASVVSIAVVSLVFIDSTFAQTEKYYCDVYNDNPATFMETEEGIIPIIRWVSNHIPPKERCEVVSQRFQTFHDNEELDYLTYGESNGKPVICTAEQPGGDCQNILFTVLSGEEPKKILYKLLDRRGLGGGNVINEGGGKRVYINFNGYVNRLLFYKQNSG